ncbi:hypothetical protein VOLCADRAFT_106830 [Volvox carteri f. nagariensis]|uniref:Secreted protein n=1 Tax=Volvox carteri f. nagariensis TaxID=3068 RepID=D8UA13_VOLCA|nr:uncharacterized protein VOLCADRAFT_106830 [Volvox carteri f. nagariensis]EFJ43348.1 hypothetical protein VOLCADRAFT_106830 [Volvox carteri f. nagariensis]|eukprot:XP_002955495.1 hypothetical protein VOLCADRAFT_106830 [Volvox carteri f. nagariensis]
MHDGLVRWLMLVHAPMMARLLADSSGAACRGRFCTCPQSPIFATLCIEDVTSPRSPIEWFGPQGPTSPVLNSSPQHYYHGHWSCRPRSSAYPYPVRCRCPAPSSHTACSPWHHRRLGTQSLGSRRQWRERSPHPCTPGDPAETAGPEVT